MYRLYHYPICPFSRKVRIHLAAKEIGFELIQESFWERRKEFIAMNPSGTIPVLFDNGSATVVSGSSVIIEYVEEKHKENNFLGDTPIKRAEIRRLQSWFDDKFYHEVSKYILDERYFNRYLPGAHSPSSEILLIARKNLNTHMSYIEYILETRKYLGGDRISVADFSAAAQLSVLDYFGDINWNHHLAAKEWYSLIKSHKSFGEVLKDRLASITPPEYYSKLDF